MHKIRRLKPRLMLPVSDRPSGPTPIDAETARNKGTSVAIEATSESLQASKTAQTPSLPEMIEQRTRENGRLRQEHEHQQRKQGGELYLLEEVRLVIAKLQYALIEYHKLQSAVDHEFSADTMVSPLSDQGAANQRLLYVQGAMKSVQSIRPDCTPQSYQRQSPGTKIEDGNLSNSTADYSEFAHLSACHEKFNDCQELN
ncbi:hypothetical protein EG329_007410 [Mollisiaceae sp. DMI_Dod_QoI]|nr:hypothetical protein EG329_007410 [Helotiales sp. DMI_Dod_QoI]